MNATSFSSRREQVTERVNNTLAFISDKAAAAAAAAAASRSLSPSRTRERRASTSVATHGELADSYLRSLLIEQQENDSPPTALSSSFASPDPTAAVTAAAPPTWHKDGATSMIGLLATSASNPQSRGMQRASSVCEQLNVLVGDFIAHQQGAAYSTPAPTPRRDKAGGAAGAVGAPASCSSTSVSRRGSVGGDAPVSPGIKPAAAAAAAAASPAPPSRSATSLGLASTSRPAAAGRSSGGGAAPTDDQTLVSRNSLTSLPSVPGATATAATSTTFSVSTVGGGGSSSSIARANNNTNRFRRASTSVTEGAAALPLAQLLAQGRLDEALADARAESERLSAVAARNRPVAYYKDERTWSPAFINANNQKLAKQAHRKLMTVQATGRAEFDAASAFCLHKAYRNGELSVAAGAGAATSKPSVRVVDDDRAGTTAALLTSSTAGAGGAAFGGPSAAGRMRRSSSVL